MWRTVGPACIALLAASCADNFWDASGDELDRAVAVEREAVDAYTAAHEVIVLTRPRATSLMASELNLILVNNGIMETVSPGDLEVRVLGPLSGGEAPTVCPYLEPRDGGGAPVSCRYLVDRAIDSALLESAELQGDVEAEVEASYGARLDDRGLRFVKGWAGEAVLSGIDSGASHAIQMLREQALCDQEPTESEAAFTLGTRQGHSLLEEAEAVVLPTVPETQCDTDLIASTVLAEAEGRVEGFVSSHAVCAGYDVSELALSVDLAQAEVNRLRGVEEGLREAYEALRVRLVSTWECTPCRCYIRYSGTGPTQCFATDSDEHPQQLINRGVPMIDQSECSATPVPVGSPLVVDLDGDGVRLSRDRAPFDLLATGEVPRIPVLEGRDAFLALDEDGDGRIESGAELFGNATTCVNGRCSDGVAALSQHDVDRDGRIDEREPVFARLRLWRDADRDGQGSGDELSTLADAGVRSIDLASRLDLSWVDAEGNAATRSLTFERRDGRVGSIQDVWFSLEFAELPLLPLSAGAVSTLHRRDRGPARP